MALKNIEDIEKYGDYNEVNYDLIKKDFESLKKERDKYWLVKILPLIKKYLSIDKKQDLKKKLILSDLIDEQDEYLIELFSKLIKKLEEE